MKLKKKKHKMCNKKKLDVLRTIERATILREVVIVRCTG